MYDTIDPSPGEFWGLLTGIQQQSHPLQVLATSQDPDATGRVQRGPAVAKQSFLE